MNHWLYPAFFRPSRQNQVFNSALAHHLTPHYLPQNDVPPPGAYYRRSTLERDGRVCGSVSAKGYGTGFVSNAPRFKDLNTLQQAYLPGPGSYTVPAEGAQEGTKLTSFSSLKRVRYFEERSMQRLQLGVAVHVD